MSGMEPHTEEAHMIERMRTVKDGAYFEIVTVVEDRHALTSAYTYTRYYKKQKDEITENICGDEISDLERLAQQESGSHSLRPRAAGEVAMRSLLWLGVATWAASCVSAQTKAAAPPDLTGVYAITSNKAVLPGGLKNSGAPAVRHLSEGKCRRTNR